MKKILFSLMVMVMVMACGNMPQEEKIVSSQFEKITDDQIKSDFFENSLSDAYFSWVGKYNYGYVATDTLGTFENYQGINDALIVFEFVKDNYTYEFTEINESLFFIKTATGVYPPEVEGLKTYTISFIDQSINYTTGMQIGYLTITNNDTLENYRYMLEI